MFLAVLSTSCWNPSKILAQTRTVYELVFLPGFELTLAQRGPREMTEVSKVKFFRPVTKTVGGMFNIMPDGKLFYGIEFLYDEFDYGYGALSHDVASSTHLYTSSGILSANDRVSLLKTGIRCGYRFFDTRKFQLMTAIIPSVGYYSESALLKDTSLNFYERYSNAPAEIWYLNYPPYQREGLSFLLKGTLEFQYNWNRHFATSVMVSYQQGFSSFVIDTVEIVRPYEYTGLKRAKYWTKVNGTALQWHFGFKYVFGRNE